MASVHSMVNPDVAERCGPASRMPHMDGDSESVVVDGTKREPRKSDVSQGQRWAREYIVT